MQKIGTNRNGLPEGWKVAKLGEVVSILDNLRKPINSEERKKRIGNKGTSELFPYYGATGQVGWIDDYLTDGEYILVGEDGAPFLDRFKEKAYKIRGKTWVNNHAHILKGIEGVTLNDFILHYLNSIDYREYVNGTTRLKLTKSALAEIPIPVASLNVQHQIVSRLEELFSELDNSVSQLKTAQQQLKVYRQSVLQWAFEGKLTGQNQDLQDERMEQDAHSARFTYPENLANPANPDSDNLPDAHDSLRDAGKNQANQDNPENQGSDNLPEGWKWVRIGDIAEINPRLKNKNDFHPDFEIQFIPMKLVEEVVNRVYLTETRKFSEVQKGSYTPFIDGDVLFAKVTPCMENGKIAVVRGLKNGLGFGSSEFHVLRPSGNIDSNYLFYFVVSDNFRNEAERAMTGAVGLRRVPRQFIETKEIPLPPMKQQQQIIQFIESRLSVADKLEESISQSLQQAEALRQSILKQAFAGRLL